MTTNVITVAPETPAREIAQTLLDHGISAVPVIDPSAGLVGIVSEGDLIGRTEPDRLARRDWWLLLYANADVQDPRFLSRAQRDEIRARDIMSAPVVTIDEMTDVSEIARVLATYHLKRVPVMRGDSVVGIVSRADLLRALAAQSSATGKRPEPHHGLLSAALSTLDKQFSHPSSETITPAHENTSLASRDHRPTVAEFQRLIEDFEQEKMRVEDEKERAAVEQRRRQLEELIDHHVVDENWNGILQKARLAASHGQKEMLLLRFPSTLCTDGGRAVNALLPDWPKTLRGEAAEIYLRWERELKSQGFHLSARVLDFPGGMPGDIGLFLIWER